MYKSLKNNYIYNLINTVSGLLFPLITFPYASRVMMADGIGHVNFYSSIIGYISLLSCLGIPMYAIREIAKVADDIALRGKTAVEILLLHTMLTILGYVGVTIIAATVAEVQVDIPLFLILSLTIFFTAIGCEWFYQGVEDFKYITIRGLVVKVISVILLFVLVKSKDDLYLYAGYTVFGVLGGNIFNFLRLRKYISLKRLNFMELCPLRHLLPAMHIFALNLIVSLYSQLNSIMLGFMANDTAVGLFAASSKITHLLLSISLALSTTMLPRMSSLAAKGDVKEFQRKSNVSMRFTVAIGLPIVVGLIFTSKELIILFCGATYASAGRTLQLLSPIVLVIGMGCVTGMQTLYPLGKINLVIFSTAVGAVVNVMMNLWLIPLYQQDGTAISTSIAEITVTLSSLIVGRRYFSFQFFSRSYLCYIIATVIMAFVISVANQFISTGFIHLLSIILIGTASYIISLSIMREQLFCDTVIAVWKRVQNRNNR